MYSAGYPLSGLRERGTKVLWVGSNTCSSSWTPGLPRDKGALTLVREGNFPYLVGIPHVVGLVFLLRGVKLVQEASRWSRIPSIAGGWMVNNYSPNRRGRTGRGNQTTQPITGQGVHSNRLV